VILETSRELHKGFLGDIYLVCFVAVFIFVIMSVFISIIQVRRCRLTLPNPS